ncbi:MAG: hypothetical protein D6772_00795, partial [Bacteroidetes bacterium]
MYRSQGWIVFCGLLLIGSVSLPGQAYQLQILLLAADSQQIARTVDWPEATQADSMQLLAALGHFIDELHEQAYLEASVDTLIWTDRRCSALVHLGPAYEWLALSPGNTPREWLSKVGFRERLYRRQALRFAEWQALQAKLVRVAAEHGFPFAQVALDSLRWDANGTLSARIATQTGTLILTDPLKQVGDLRLNPRYLAQYLG